MDMECQESAYNRKGDIAEKGFCFKVKRPLFLADRDQTYTTPIKTTYFFDYLSHQILVSQSRGSRFVAISGTYMVAMSTNLMAGILWLFTVP
jgi:hypothetical protein